jgi:hypothetical protein
MEQQQNYLNILLFIAVFFGAYYIYIVFFQKANNIEGMSMESAFADETAAANSATESASSTVNGANGIAGNGPVFYKI